MYQFWVNFSKQQITVVTEPFVYIIFWMIRVVLISYSEEATGDVLQKICS